MIGIEPAIVQLDAVPDRTRSMSKCLRISAECCQLCSGYVLIEGTSGGLAAPHGLR